jgi:hypothetical protein
MVSGIKPNPSSKSQFPIGHEQHVRSSEEPPLITKRVPYVYKNDVGNSEIGFKKVEAKHRKNNKTKIMKGNDKEQDEIEKERVDREVIIIGVPTQPKDRPDHAKEIESLMTLLSELDPALGLGSEGIKIKTEDIAKCSRQVFHHNK